MATETTTAGSPGKVSHAYDYDASGNTVLRPDGAGGAQNLAWDPEGHLTTVTDTEGDALGGYVYGADGQRLMAADETGETLYLADTQLHQDAATGGVRATRYYKHAGLTIGSRSTTEGLTWITADHQGTGTLSISPDTADVSQRRQDPYGNPRGREPASWHDKKGFVGGAEDPTGLTHLGAREYDPRIGRFISDDPITSGDPQQANGYVYANNTPIVGSDPSGLMWDHGGGGSSGGSSGTPSNSGGGDTMGSIGGFFAGIGEAAWDSASGVVESVVEVVDCVSDVEACIDDIMAAVEYIIENPVDAVKGALYSMVEPVVTAWEKGDKAKAMGKAAFLAGELAYGGIKKIRDWRTTPPNPTGERRRGTGPTGTLRRARHHRNGA